MILEKLSVGHMGVNCYIVGDPDEILVIDPGDCAEKIYAYLRDKKYSAKYIVLTHCHFDHILAAEKVRKLTGAKIIAGKNEAENLLDGTINMTSRFYKIPIALKADSYVAEKDEIISGEYRFLVLETPGHTSGGICLYCKEEKTLFSGDTLFRCSVGRSDFATGNHSVLIDSIKTKLLTLPENVLVYPGHDDKTTIGFEKMNNPYIR